MNVVGEDVVLDIDGVHIYARRADDLFFVEEVYFSNTYNICTVDDICAIDIGMNVGLATLYLARKPNVKEVHSFEPFGETFERGVANIRLNSDLARKISTYNVGLGGKDEELTIFWTTTTQAHFRPAVRIREGRSKFPCGTPQSRSGRSSTGRLEKG